jgi:chromate transporter
MMEDELVRRRGWLSRARFLDLLGATNLIPGPNSTEMAIHLGRERAGWRGLVLAGACFILPAFAIVLACAWAYVSYGSVPAAQGLLYGVKPVMIAVVLQALWGLGRTATRTRTIAAAGSVSLLAAALGVHELVVLLAAGLGLGALSWTRRHRRGLVAALVAPLGALAPAAPVPGAVAGAAATGAATPFGLTSLFIFFLKVGSVLYGSGYVLLAFLRADLVHRWGWMTEGQLLDAVAVGQSTRRRRSSPSSPPSC